MQDPILTACLPEPDGENGGAHLALLVVIKVGKIKPFNCSRAVWYGSMLGNDPVKRRPISCY